MPNLLWAYWKLYSRIGEQNKSLSMQNLKRQLYVYRCISTYAFRFTFWKYGINKIARSSFMSTVNCFAMQSSIITDYILDIRLWSLSQSALSLSDVSYPWFLSPVSNTSCIKCLGTARVISLNYLLFSNDDLDQGRRTKKNADSIHWLCNIIPLFLW